MHAYYVERNSTVYKHAVYNIKLLKCLFNFPSIWKLKRWTYIYTNSWITNIQSHTKHTRSVIIKCHQVVFAMYAMIWSNELYLWQICTGNNKQNYYNKQNRNQSVKELIYQSSSGGQIIRIYTWPRVVNCVTSAERAEHRILLNRLSFLDSSRFCPQARSTPCVPRRRWGRGLVAMAMVVASSLPWLPRMLGRQPVGRGWPDTTAADL